MPWLPELFSAPALEQFEEKQQREVVTVGYFEGLLSGELDPLIESFAGEPQLHHPVRGRIKGARAFEAFVGEEVERMTRRNLAVRDVARVVTKRRGFEEVVLGLDGKAGRIELPHAMVADHDADGRLEELRIYFSRWPMRSRHVNRPPVLQPDPEVQVADVVGEYQRALAAGDLEAILATFEADGYAREPAGGEYFHRGRDGLRSFYELLFSSGGGIPLEHCAAIDDGRACALEYNVVRWGASELPPQAGVAVYERGPGGKLAAARIYDDVDPPLGSL
ncbi:MAG TPA: nuclear transport factor 2 family protein [Solirubrobacteraceae bacterium]|nr:nuclear transport factor 2 family protein [Solirubrobacteraceae bacterium]